MGNNNNNNNNDNIIDDDYYHRLEMECDISCRLHQYINSKMEQLVKENKFQKNNTKISTIEERQIISQITPPSTIFYKGLFGGLSTFVLLRGLYRTSSRFQFLVNFNDLFFSSYFFRNNKKNRSSSSSLSSSTTTTTTTTTITTTPPPTTMQPSTTTSSLQYYALMMGFDISISCIVGFGIILKLALSTGNSITKQMSKIPLLPGKMNTVSYTYCQATIDAYRLVIDEYTVKNNITAIEIIHNPQTIQLQGMYELYQNCLRRESYIKQQQKIVVLNNNNNNNNNDTHNSNSNKQHQCITDNDDYNNNNNQDEDSSLSKLFLVFEIPPPGVPKDFPISSINGNTHP